MVHAIIREANGQRYEGDFGNLFNQALERDPRRSRAGRHSLITFAEPCSLPCSRIESRQKEG